jgi:Adenosine/AMP deaminase N-terminal
MSAKRQTYDNCFDQMCFPPARHFFDAKSDIEGSEVFRIIKRMPKGERFKKKPVYFCSMRAVSLRTFLLREVFLLLVRGA